MKDYKYSLTYKYRQWIGKPDPSGLGTTCWHTNDIYSLVEKVSKLEDSGHMVMEITGTKTEYKRSL